MSGWGKGTEKYGNRTYDSLDPEEMSLRFRGSSDIGEFIIKGESTSSFAKHDEREYEHKVYLSIDQMQAMYKLLTRFKDEYGF